MRAPARFDNVLVIVFPARGDVLLASALVRGVKRAHPDAQVDVLTQLGQGDVLIGNPDVRRVIETKRGASHREGFAYIRDLWRRYDVAISTSLSDRAALYAFASAPFRASVVLEPMRWQHRVYQARVPYQLGRHTLLENSEIGAALGLGHCLDVVPPRDADAGERLDAVFPEWRDRPFAVLHPTPRVAYKRWQIASWAGLAQALAAKGLELVVTGSAAPAERAYLDELLPRMPAGTRDLAGALTLAQVTALLERADLYVGVDTLIGHVAASVGAPSVVIFGPSMPSKWAPWPKGRHERSSPYARVGSSRVGNVYVLQGVADCVPCDQAGCLDREDSHADCLDTLPVGRALEACEEMLAFGANEGGASDGA